MPIVAVELSQPDVPPVLEAVLLDACSSGLRRAQCRAAGVDVPEARAVAVVSWSDAAHVRIEVGVAPPEGGWRVRELEFSDHDPETERWRAAGFTIALLVGEERFADVAVDRPDEPVSSEALEPAFRALELKALTGTGLAGAELRWGGEARVGLGPAEAPWFAGAALQYARAPEQSGVQLRWLNWSVGAGLRLRDIVPGIEARARAEVLFEHVAASASRDGVSAQRAAWVPGLRFGADLVWPASGHFAVVGSVDAFWLDGSTPVTFEGARVAESAGGGLVASLGVEGRL